MKTNIIRVGTPQCMNPRWRYRIDTANTQHDFHFPIRFDKITHWWWVAIVDKKFAGFAACVPEEFMEDYAMFLGPCGIVPEFRGLGLQKRFIRVRELHARRLKYKVLFSHTHSENRFSANNFIRTGFKMCDPWKRFTNPEENIFFRKEIGR